MRKLKLFILLGFIGMSFTACKKENQQEEPKSAYQDGIFVVNEGNFGQGNAAISFTNESLSEVNNGIFEEANQVALGDQAQSIGFSGVNAYIVVTGSSKIEVVNRDTMEKKVTIASDLTNPRYFESVSNNEAIVTCWGDATDSTDDYLAIVNTTSNTVTGQIPVDLGPEKMVKNDDYLFIAHKGAWGTNHIISVYDLVLKQITTTITVGDRPNSLVIDDNNNLWVLCSGEPSWAGTETAGQLYKIDIDNNFNIDMTLDFATTDHPNFLNIDNGNLYYYLNGKVYQMSTQDNNLPTNEFITYPTAYNMETYNGKLYITDAKDYQQEGEIIQYDLTNGQETGRKTVGIIPGDLAFIF